MKRSIALACVVATILLTQICVAQTVDDVRIANLEEYLAMAPPEPLGLQPAVLFSDNVKRSSEREVWFTYVKARQQFAMDNNFEMPETEGEIEPTYLEELAARRELAAALKEMGRKVGKTHRAYAADLEKVIEADLFDEYIFTVHHRESWEAGDKELAIDKYKAWAAENIPDHEPLSYASRVSMASNRTSDAFIVIDSELEVESEAAFWLKYSMLRIDFRKDNQLPIDVLVGEEVKPTYKEELAARRGILKDFDDVQDSLCEATRNGVKEMAKAESNGFLREYVWKYLHLDSWEEPAELKLEEFQAWADKELTDHKPPTRAILLGR